ncbi:MAG: hypothetical protein JWM02_739 [Frankiales bacterium]|nr:hypothetical protein [Frankiales bacterium]
MDFTSIISTPPSGRRTAVVLDYLEYAQAVILQGQPIPWGDPSAYSQFVGQAQGLLRPDTTLLDLGALYDFLLASDDALTNAMSARSRTGYALRTLLADEKTASAALELASVVSQTSAAPLVLQVPSPLLWLARTHELSGAGTAGDLDLDHAENAAMYVADWLRRLSVLPVSMLLLDERWTGAGVLPLVDTAAYVPVSNVTDHYRWALARRTQDGITTLLSTTTGTSVPQDYWLSDVGTAPTGDFLLAEIPADAVPETVLSQLAKLD